MRLTSNRTRRRCSWVAAGIMATFLPACAQAQESVTVCVHQDTIVRGLTLARAEAVAGRIFAQAGVRIHWSSGHASLDAISIEFSERTPAEDHPGAMAFALPYEGIHITVFFDRISRMSSEELAPTVLGHVLAHEITHILQGIDRHSDRGVMKAHWTCADLTAMASKPLSFTSEDIQLIQSGLAERTLASTGHVHWNHGALSWVGLIPPSNSMPGIASLIQPSSSAR